MEEMLDPNFQEERKKRKELAKLDHQWAGKKENRVGQARGALVRSRALPGAYSRTSRPSGSDPSERSKAGLERRF